MATTFKVSGLRELGEAMRGLQKEVALRIAGSMTNAGAQVVKKAAVANITRNPSVETGSLRDSVIVKKIPKSQTQLTSEHIVTVRKFLTCRLLSLSIAGSPVGPSTPQFQL